MAKKLVRLWERPSKDGKIFTYCIVYYDLDGKRKRKSLGHHNRRKAERQAAEIENRLQAKYIEPDRMRLDKLLQDYLERTRTQIEPSTADSAAYRMRDFIAANGNIYVDQVTFRHCERFQQYCTDRGLSPASVNTHIKMVKRIFSLAMKRGQIESNPFNGIQLMKTPRKNIRLLSDNEVQRLLRMTSHNLIWKARILLAKTAGLRRGEILNLTINDMDFDKAKITVQPKPNTENSWRWVVKDKERRELPMIDEVAKIMARIHSELQSGQPYLMLTEQRYRYVLKLKNAGTLSDRMAKCPDNNFRRNFLHLCKNAKVEKVTFHDLRATCITEWFEMGLMPHEIQRLAGHSSIETTMKYYVGIREEMIDRAREASSTALNPDFVTKLLHRSKKASPKAEEALQQILQVLENTGLKKIGARGLEPPTS